ncbi:MAG TPA: TlyA family RNA methyltransferase [Arcobacter sp.]|jgi:23S rRNA (cytidine1920-2'-O)/16S rRNA (cytidine1409-2'-O)-methyltransferase|nr:TlyA family RNA methyltransferase [Arcobacter sp.]
MRLDQYIHQQLNVQSRNKASELIRAKQVLVDGKIITKTSFSVNESNEIQILQEEIYVSRAAEKLNQFLLENPIELENKIALDIGSSTGGFTQILLKNNVQSVTCVDVGSNQLHESLKNNSKLIIQENTDIRVFQNSYQYDIVTCDVSFISILTILNDIDRLAKRDIIILFKPQFEVGNNVKRDSKGVVKDMNAIKRAAIAFETEAFKLAWKLIVKENSKVSGKEGNVEIVYYFKKDNM